MPSNQSPTVEMSLQALSDAVGKAGEDLRAVRTVLDRARADIASRNTSITRTVIVAATRAIDQLRGVDEALADVLKELEQRD
jgi:alkylation response protein AidB-like acyl-CoA dehydrogenase